MLAESFGDKVFAVARAGEGSLGRYLRLISRRLLLSRAKPFMECRPSTHPDYSQKRFQAKKTPSNNPFVRYRLISTDYKPIPTLLV